LIDWVATAVDFTREEVLVFALMAGTSKAADLLGMADKTGTLQPGKATDIVAVPGNPLIDIEATQHPTLVMKQGVVYVGGK
jgi:imidazolonepropionase-like amidohydrolase